MVVTKLTGQKERKEGREFVEKVVHTKLNPNGITGEVIVVGRRTGKLGKT